MSSKDNNLENYEFSGTGLTTKERNWAKKRFDSYQAHYHVEKFSELQLLESLVFREALQERYKEKLEKLAKNAKVKSADVVPTHIIRALDDNLKYILELKSRLGLDKQENVKDPYEIFRNLSKKFDIWKEENQASRELVCPHCGELVLLNIKTTEYEAKKHPFFKDKVLCNEHLWAIYKEGKITDLDVAKILLGKEVRTADYVKWLESKIYSPKSNPSLESEKDSPATEESN